jgi:hypothetical protein
MQRRIMVAIIGVLAMLVVGVESAAAQSFAGPAHGGKTSGTVKGSTFLYNGQSFQMLNGRVSFPDCTSYRVSESGRLSGKKDVPNCKPAQPGAPGRGVVQQRVAADGRVMTFMTDPDHPGDIVMIDDGRGKGSKPQTAAGAGIAGQRSADPYQLDPAIAQSDSAARKLPAPPAASPRGQQSADPFQLDPPKPKAQAPESKTDATATKPNSGATATPTKKKPTPCDPKTPGCIKSPAGTTSTIESTSSVKAGV